MSTEKQHEGGQKAAMAGTPPSIQEGMNPGQAEILAHQFQARPSVFVSGENLAEYEGLAAAWFRHYQPRNPVEAQFVRQAVDLSWMIDRAKRHEAAHLSRRVSDAVTACAGESSAVISEAADMAMFDSTSQGERIRRGLLTLQRDLIRTVDTITKMREREAKFFEANVPVTQPVTEEVRPESVVQHGNPKPVEVVTTSVKPAPASAPSPARPEPHVPDLFDGIPARIETKAKQPARRPDAAKLMANHRRGVQGSPRPRRPRPDLEQLLNDSRLNKTRFGPFSEISCVRG